MALEDQLKEIARKEARMALAASPSFRTLSQEVQKNVYRDTIESEYNKLAQKSGLAVEQKKVPKASDSINDKRHDKTLDMSDAADTFGDFVNTVDFPSFVRDLLKSVFDANMDVIKAQNDEFMKLMKAATTDLSKFIKQVDDTTAFGHLAENNSDDFSMNFEDDPDNPGQQKAVLTDKSGEPVDLGDNQLKVKIMDAKIELAKQHQASLKQLVAMGLNRIVVEDGEIEAGVLFDFKADRKVNKADKAMNKNSNSTGASGGYSRGLLGAILGGPRIGASHSNRSTNLSVSSASSSAHDEMKAKLSGKVRIKFKTDYANLDNFVNKMYETEQKAIDAKAGINQDETQ